VDERASVNHSKSVENGTRSIIEFSENKLLFLLEFIGMVGLVCDSCDAFNEMSAGACAVCGAPMAAAAPSAPSTANGSHARSAPAAENLSMNCPKCGAENPEGFRFCGNCGFKLDQPQQQNGASEGAARTLYFGEMQTPNRAKLILIKGEGLDGVSYHLNADQHGAGRVEGDIVFPDDPLLSPRHATFFYDNENLCVRDEGSANGVFVRIVGSVPLGPGARFLVGEQLLQFEPTDPDDTQPEADEEGTYFYGSPRRPGFFKLVQLLRGGDIGMIFRAPAEEVTMGREGNDINFPDDPFISGQHARVCVTPDGYILEDLDSKNGTFVRVDEPKILQHGDYVFLGQQLLRVEIT
jgi:pSer/pThr/pTyr-binding forkhead associated (FHA) protein/ribosomal protein L40E